MKKIFFTYCSLLLSIIAFSQHYPSNSQYMFDQMLINPAYAGNREVTSISAISRNQWAGFEGAPKTQTIVAHTPISKKRIGLGISLLHDKIGINNQTSLFTYYSYRFPIQKGKLSIGFSTGINMLKSYYNEVITTVPDFMFENTYSYNHMNIGTGFFYKHPKYFIGISIPYFIDYRKEIDLTGGPGGRHINTMISSGMLFSLNENFKLKPSFLFKTYSQYSSQLDLNCNIIYNDVLWLGLSLRTDDALVWLIEYQVNPQLRFGFSHDFPFTEIAHYSIGTNEILLRYEFGYKTNAKETRFF